MSAILSSLKLVSAKRQNSVDPIEFRRNKLNEKLTHQINLAKAMQNGESYTVKRQRNVRDEETGLSSVVEVSRKVKQWWFVNNETKKIAVQLFYGNKVIDFAKGKNAVEVSNADELLSVLGRLQEAVLDGSLDAQISVAADSVKARFVK